MVDHALSPTRGYILNMHAESGHKYAENTTLISDSTGQDHRLSQRRLTARGRVYIPLTGRSLLATGGELMLVRSPKLNESDLFRVGELRASAVMMSIAFGPRLRRVFWQNTDIWLIV